MTVAAVVLAAGGGTRFTGSQHKLRTPFRGRPLLSWALDAAAGAGFPALFVVAGAEPLDDLLPAGAVKLTNPAWADGMATSLSLGWRAARERGHDAIVVGLGDQPLVPAGAWRRVADEPGPIVTATFAGRRRPPVKLEAAVWPLLPASGDEGARSVMREQPGLVRQVACEGEPIDIDTVEDLARWS